MPSDYMWLLSAYGEVPYTNNINNVAPLPINEDNNPLTINTVSWNKVQIPASVLGRTVSLIYVASPKLATATALSDTIPIPDQMIEALLNYIGYRGHGSMDGNIQAESNTHYQRFEISVKRLVKEGMFTEESVQMPTRLRDKGFM